MDLEEWEYLSEDSRFIDQLHRQDRKGKRVIPRETLSLQPNSVIDTNYFQQFLDPSGVSVSPTLVIPVPVEFDLHIPKPPNDSVPKEEVIPPPDSQSPAVPFQVFGSDPDQETVSSQVFFKKMKGNEFADMKLDSPRSTNRGFVPQIELGKTQFEEEDEDTGVEADKGVFGCDENWADPEVKEWGNDEKQGGLNIWKMGMTGIGALFTFGFACATVCVIAVATRHRENKHQYQKLHCHVYTDDDKRMTQVVQHAAKLNETISAARGRAHVTIGGYLDDGI